MEKIYFFQFETKLFSICKQTLNGTKNKVFFFECFWLIRIFDSISNTDRGVHRGGGGWALGSYPTPLDGYRADEPPPPETSTNMKARHPLDKILYTPLNVGIRLKGT